MTNRVPPPKRINRTEPIRRDRALVVLRNRLEAYVDGGEPTAGEEPHAPEQKPARAPVDAPPLGQDGQKRGLRAGPLHIEAARGAYNKVEWSGSKDRRARAGRKAKTEI